MIAHFLKVCFVQAGTCRMQHTWEPHSLPSCCPVASKGYISWLPHRMLSQFQPSQKLSQPRCMPVSCLWEASEVGLLQWVPRRKSLRLRGWAAGLPASGYCDIPSRGLLYGH